MGGRASGPSPTGAHRHGGFENGQDMDEQTMLEPARTPNFPVEDGFGLAKSSTPLPQNAASSSSVTGSARPPRRVPRRHLLLKQLAEAGEESALPDSTLIRNLPSDTVSSVNLEKPAAPFAEETDARPEPEPALMPEPKGLGQSEVANPLSPTGSCDAEFEMWVETDLQAEWCLEDNSNSQSRGRREPTGDSSASASQMSWKDGCCTAALRRRWEDFEALGHSNHTLNLAGGGGEGEGLVDGNQDGTGSGSMSSQAALEVLGLPTSREPDAQELASAFRQRSRTCHPDKAGTADEFNLLVMAYQTATKRFGAR